MDESTFLISSQRHNIETGIGFIKQKENSESPSQVKNTHDPSSVSPSSLRETCHSYNFWETGYGVVISISDTKCGF